jgi:predicted  nucleic acid-binding Zn-ribbon protein
MTLTPQRFQEVRQSSQILFCESCGRILFYQP